MPDQIMLREYQKEDAAALETVIRKTWRYDEFCAPKTAAKLARVYLYSCLANQSFTRVVSVNREAAGIIMGKNCRTHQCPLKFRVRMLTALASLFLTREGRSVSRIFGNVDLIDAGLLKANGREYPGELAFFVMNPDFRGQGLGKLLFQSLLSYMKSEGIGEFYLFTDTSCNYGFYEHQGMTRRGEKKHHFKIKGWQSEMTFFLYDYSFPSAGA